MIRINNYPPDLILKVLRKIKTFNGQKTLLERGINEFPNFITFYVRLYSISIHEKNTGLLKILQDGFTKTKSYTIGFLIGKYFEDTESFNEAISHFQEYIELVTKDSEKKYFYYSLGTTFFKKGDINKSLEYLGKVSDIDTSYISLLSLLQATYICLQENDKYLALLFIERIRIDENFYQIDLNDNLVWLESEYPTELYHIIDFKIFEKKLKELRKGYYSAGIKF